MVEKVEVQGTVVNQFDSIDEFVEALKSSGAPRIYTFTEGGIFGIGARYTAAGVDKNGAVIGYLTPDVSKGLGDRVKPIYDIMAQQNMPEVDGIIRVTEDGSIYQIFQTEDTSSEPDVDKSFNAWLSAAKSAGGPNTILQFVTEEDKVLIDATVGNSHLVTMLDGVNNRTLDYVLFEVVGAHHLLDYKVQNNGPALQWYKNLNSK